MPENRQDAKSAKFAKDVEEGAWVRGELCVLEFGECYAGSSGDQREAR